MDLLQMKQMMDRGVRLTELSLRVVYYARVSTDKDEQLNSLGNQRQFYHDFITKNANWTFAGEYIDEGISGTGVKKRTSFLKMIDDAKNGRFDLIVTKEISRFSRNTLDSIAYTRELLRHGVGVLFHNDNINTLDSDAELRLTIMAAIAQEEVNKLSQRTRFGFSKAQENGVLLGQDNIYGYRKVNKTLIVIPEEADVIRRIFSCYCKGDQGLRAIAHQLEAEGIFTRSGKAFTAATLRRMIDNPKYKGFYAGRKYTSVDYRDHKKLRVDPTEWIVFQDDRIPAIVEPELWDEANRILKQRGEAAKSHAQASQNRYAYSGKLICGTHGTTFHRHVYHSKRRGDRECWNCRLYRQKGKENGCDSPTVYSSELDQILTRLYEDLFLDRDRLFAEYLKDMETALKDSDDRSERKKIEGEQQRLQLKKDKLLELVLDGTVSKDEFREKNSLFQQQLLSLSSRLAELDACRVNPAAQKHFLAELRRSMDVCWEQKNGFLSSMNHLLLDRILVQKGSAPNDVHLEIHLHPGDTHIRPLRPGGEANNIFSLSPMGISQAQVSRLEKGALMHLKKYV